MPPAVQDIWFDNPVVGQRSRIITLPGETAGRSFVLEYINRAGGGENAVPAHVHWNTRETFEILRGRACYRLGGETKTAAAGERVVMPPRIPHMHPWSAGHEERHVRQTSEVNPPDLRGLNASLQAAITIQGLAKAGRVNAKGTPKLLQLGVLLETTIPATYIAGPPIALQRLLFGVLARLGRLALQNGLSRIRHHHDPGTSGADLGLWVHRVRQLKTAEVRKNP